MNKRRPGHTHLMLPAYNEAESIGGLLDRAGAVPCLGGVLVVDDGSEDGTAEVVERWQGRIPCTVVRHSRNRGLGEAVKTGFAWAAANLAAGDVLVTMDADDTHDPALIPDMVELVRQGADVVIASRFQSGGGEIGVPLHRRTLSQGVRLLLRAVRPVPGVRDYSCGYRAYRVGALVAAMERAGPGGVVTTTGFTCMVEVLLRLAALGCRFAEVPLVLRYDRKKGASKMRVLPTAARYLAVLHTVPRQAVIKGQHS